MRLCLVPDVSGWALDFRAKDLAIELNKHDWKVDVVPKRSRTGFSQNQYNHVHAFHPTSGPADSCTLTNPSLVSRDTLALYPSQKSFVVANIEMQNEMKRLGYESTLIPNLVNTRHFDIVKRVPNARPCIGLVAKRTSSAKGYGVWDRFKQSHPEFEWVCADANYRGDVISRDQMPSFYHGLDCLLILSDYEAGPNSLLEALACGIPVLSTNVGMSRSLINSKNGALINRQPEEIIQDIYRILEMKISPHDCRQTIFDHGCDLASGALIWNEFLRSRIRPITSINRNRA